MLLITDCQIASATVTIATIITIMTITTVIEVELYH